ncbi:MAG: DUF3488 and DUF4129 domain-containing transglutaminase family protein [Phycisphaerales bacterium JB039]
MRLHRSLRRLVLITALLSIAAYAVAAGSAMIALLGLPGAVALWWAGALPQARLAPRIVINIGLLLVIVLAAAASVAGPAFGVETVANLIVALILGKLFDWRTARDAAQILTLSVFLAVAAALTSLQLALALLLIPLTPLVILTAMVYQLSAGQELAQAEASRLVPANAPAHGIGVAAGPGAARQLRWVATLALGLIVVSGVVVFIITPRGISPGVFSGLESPAVGRKVDFAETVRLGRGGLISESQRVVMDMEVSDTDGVPMGGPDRIFYLRGAVLGTYDNGVWTRSRDSVSKDTVGQGGPQAPIKFKGHDSGPALEQRITLRNAGESRPYLFAVQRPFEWRIDEPVRLMYNIDEGIVRVGDAPPQLSYTVTSTLHISPRAEAAQAAHEDVQYLPVGLGFDSPVVTALTGEVLAAAGLDATVRARTASEIASIVHEIRRYLSEEYAYTLDVQRAEGEPIEWFLTEGRRGHCEYFASAMAAMCRSVGLGARVVTGYVAAEYNEASQTYVVREANAHAWVEVNHGDIDNPQWRTHDPSPVADVRRIHSPKPTLLARLRRWTDAIEHFWVTSVVTYDSGTRSRLLGAPSGSPLPMLSEFEERVEGLRRSGWPGLAKALLMGVGVFAGALVVLLGIPAALRRAPLGRGPRARGAAAELEQPAEGLYHDLLVAMQAVGAPKPRWRPVLTHAMELATEAPEIGAAAASVAGLYYRARFGNRPLAPEEADSAREHLRTILDSVRDGGLPQAASPSNPT